MSSSTPLIDGLAMYTAGRGPLRQANYESGRTRPPELPNPYPWRPPQSWQGLPSSQVTRRRRFSAPPVEDESPNAAWQAPATTYRSRWNGFIEEDRTAHPAKTASRAWGSLDQAPALWSDSPPTPSPRPVALAATAVLEQPLIPAALLGRPRLIPTVYPPSLTREWEPEEKAESPTPPEVSLPVAKAAGKPASAFRLFQLDESLLNILVFASVVVVVFGFLYMFSESVGSYTNSPFGVQDYFLFSIRTLLTMSMPDMGPLNSFGRLLNSLEGTFGMFSLALVSFILGRNLSSSQEAS
ncbi:MAG: hypothetical protein HY687_04710 [Chloroflexi bacterium]|nr:hypothetical protein [Chloroflexota bacterium]